MTDAELSADAVGAALGDAYAQVTYPYIERKTNDEPNPAWPFPDGGWWGTFTRTLEKRYDTVRSDAGGQQTLGAKR